MKAYEVVIMKFKAEATEKAIRQALESTTRFLQTCPGFISRQVLHSSTDGVWIDQVVWEDMSMALDAAAKFGNAPEVGEFVSLLDTSDMRMLHLTSFYQSAES